MPDRERLAADCRGEDDREHNHADAIVEQALARNRRLQRRIDRGALQDAHHRHRIGRADQRAEHQAPDQRQIEPERMGQRVEAHAHDHRRDHHADRAQHEDRPAPAPHLAPVDVQRAREQQERQHTVHQGRLKVDAGDEAQHLFADIAGGKQPVDPDNDQRRDRAHHRQPDRLGQTEEAMVDVAQRRRQHDQDCGGVERRDRNCLGHCCRSPAARSRIMLGPLWMAFS